MRLFSFAVVFTLVLLVLAPTATFSQSSHDTDMSELQRLEKVWNESHERGDADALDSLWADDMEVAVPKMPVMQKADVLKFARSGRMKFLHYQTSDTRIRLYENAAVVTGRLQRTRVMNGQEISDDLAFHKDVCAPSAALACGFIPCIRGCTTIRLRRNVRTVRRIMLKFQNTKQRTPRCLGHRLYVS